jgi:von Willebrand factor type A domain
VTDRRSVSLGAWLIVLAAGFGLSTWMSFGSPSAAQGTPPPGMMPQPPSFPPLGNPMNPGMPNQPNLPNAGMLPSLNGTVQGSGLPDQAASDGAPLDNIMILLDASYSMGEILPSNSVDLENKMLAAKRTVLDVLRTIPPNVRVGLRVYGNSANQFTSCRASTTLVPLGQDNRHLMSSKLIGLKPTGATPISYSIQRALDEDFRLVNGKRIIILISDGIETCGEDPCDLAVRMQKSGANIKINVVGLGLQDYEAVKQLRCVALATKGKFYTANTAAELANSLTSAVASETRVQATILPSPAAARSSAPQEPTRPVSTYAPKELDASGNNHLQHKEKELPAAVPIKPRKR